MFVIVHEIEIRRDGGMFLEMIAHPLALALRRLLLVVFLALGIGMASDGGMVAGAGHGDLNEINTKTC